MHIEDILSMPDKYIDILLAILRICSSYISQGGNTLFSRRGILRFIASHLL